MQAAETQKAMEMHKQRHLAEHRRKGNTQTPSRHCHDGPAYE